MNASGIKFGKIVQKQLEIGLSAVARNDGRDANASKFSLCRRNASTSICSGQ